MTEGTTTRREGDLHNYVLVTAAYWADTIADGAIRLLVLFYFYERGYTPFQLATVFAFYEVFGIITNLVGGFLAARFGLKSTLVMGLVVQIVALLMLGLAPSAWLAVSYVMVAQALSGIAKDLTKMSSKSAVKLIVADDAPGALYRWVSILTGSKNALKGVGFFLGGLLLTVTSFQTAMLLLAAMVLVALVLTIPFMHGGLDTLTGRPSSVTCSRTTGRSTCWRRLGFAVRFARRVVRRRASGLSAHRSAGGASGRSGRSWRSG